MKTVRAKRWERKAFGICKLTGQPGQFVEAHLIPRALTKLSSNGRPFIQAGEGTRPIRRWNSWYDGRLVTRAGEDILAELDTWAILEFRKHKLIWSSWGTAKTLGALHNRIGDSSWGIRRIEGIDRAKLRLFFLSLLWRAAATERPEFALIQLPNEDLEQLGRMLRQKDPNPLSFYSAQLTQLSTMGPLHNLTPIPDRKRLSSLQDGVPDRELSIYRFYLDGLIAHVYCHASDDGFTAEMGDLIVGAENRLIVSTQTFEDSLQQTKLRTIVEEALGSRWRPGA